MDTEDTILENRAPVNQAEISEPEVDPELLDTAQKTFEQIQSLCAELVTGTKDTQSQASQLLAEANALKKEVDIYAPKKR